MQNNDNQTNQKDPQNRGQNGFEYISPGLCSIWLGLGDGNITFSDELDFDPSELDIVYRGDSTEDER